jgi:putative ABC transport system permease protein
MVTPILSRSIWKYFFRHPWVILLSILGVAIGVAVVVSVDIATTSAKRAFEVSVENLTGNATHQVIGSPLGMEEDIFVRLKLEFPDLESSPVVEGYVEVRGETLQMLGLDFFSNTYLTEHLSGTGSQALLSLLLEPDTTFITGDTAERLGVLPGDTIGISVGGEGKEVNIAGLTGSKEDSTLDGIIIADISTAQEVLNKTGFIDRINLVIAEEDESTIPQLKEWLPEGTTIISTAARNESTLKITDAFSVNLTAMSLLALLVGMFLIYNTMTFSVLQRRGLIGSLRVIGATRREIFSEVLIEAGVIGFIGTSLGVFLGILLGQEMVKLVLRTVNDLYFVLTVSTFYISAGMVIKGMLLGIAVSVVASFVPAIEAASSPPQTVRLRSVMESLARRLLPHISIAGILMMAVSIAILFLSGKSILAGFVSLFMLVIGFALCVPVMVEFISRSIGRLTSKGANVLGKMAAAGIAGSLSRTGTAIAAMTVAISVVVGMGTMINSFRSTVDLWLSQALSSDVYVTTTSDISSRSDNPLPEELVPKVLAIDGVEAIKKMKTVYLEASAGVVEVHAIEPVAQSRNEYRLKEGDYIQAWESFEKGESIFLAEPYAYKNNLKVGDSVSFLTAEGMQQFPVSGIFFDYSTDQGIILMPYSLYSYYWQDSTISSMGLYLADKSDKEDIMNYLEFEVAGIPGVVVTDNFNLRQSGLDVFDRTFLITRVLEFLAIIVAFIGILSALMAYQLEKVREIGILRATGFTPRQIWGMISLQTGFMGAISGVLAIPLGLIVSVILTTIINIRSFGWSMQKDISPATILEAMAIAVGAALLASIYPSWRMSRISPAEALREE